MDQPYSARSKLLPEKYRPPRIITGDAQAAQDFFDAAIAAGQEGLMAKGLESKYEAGRRGAAWFKIKKANTLDLVVLAAEWGHGRRHGKLSNLHLGARDPNGGFIMLGKTFKGITDELLAWQTKRLQEIETHREGITVYVRPELVVEIAFNGLQDSPHYPGGLALRFARVIRYRDDKTPTRSRPSGSYTAKVRRTPTANSGHGITLLRRGNQAASVPTRYRRAGERLCTARSTVLATASGEMPFFT